MWNTKPPVLSAPDVAQERLRAEQDEARVEARGHVVPPDARVSDAGALVPVEPEFGAAALVPPQARGLGAQHPGPNPYEGFDRQFTDEGSTLCTFTAKDDRAWVWWLKFAAWLLANGAFGWLLIQPPLSDALLWKAPLWSGTAWLSWWVLFTDNGHLCTIEIWPDCFVVDGTDIFWRAYIELGLPTLVSVGKDAYALAGTYGTRYVEFCRIHAFDENDRQPQVFLAQVQFAMQQHWSDAA